MFDIDKAIKQNRLFEQAKIYGLPYKPKQKNPFRVRVSAEDIDTKAVAESVHIKRSFHNRSIDFGLRLCKARGQRHRVGGAAG